MSTATTGTSRMPFVYDSALSDEALARLIARHYPPGTDMKGNSLEQLLTYLIFTLPIILVLQQNRHRTL